MRLRVEEPHILLSANMVGLLVKIDVAPGRECDFAIPASAAQEKFVPEQVFLAHRRKQGFNFNGRIRCGGLFFNGGSFIPWDAQRNPVLLQDEACDIQSRVNRFATIPLGDQVIFMRSQNVHCDLVKELYFTANGLTKFVQGKAILFDGLRCFALLLIEVDGDGRFDGDAIIFWYYCIVYSNGIVYLASPFLRGVERFSVEAYPRLLATDERPNIKRGQKFVGSLSSARLHAVITPRSSFVSIAGINSHVPLQTSPELPRKIVAC